MHVDNIVSFVHLHYCSIKPKGTIQEESKMHNLEKEFEKNKELKKEDLKALKEWADKQPHLPEISEFEIVLFLHSCFYRSEPAKITIDNYFTARTHAPEFFSNYDVNDKINRDIHTIIYAPLPQLTHKKERVVFACLADPNPDNYTFNTQIKTFDMATTLHLHRNGTDIGIHLVTDLTGCTFAHITKLGLLGLKKFFFYLQESMPVRIVGLHFINIVPFMDKILALIKPFMKKELIDVLHLHTDDLSTLYPYVPKECLPKDYGGNAPSRDELILLQKKDFENPDNQKFFKEMETRTVNETARPGKPKNSGDVFGVEGTFKKLDID